ncbi:MAG: hypothetical protein NVS3B20_07820 [Polyangiales bacterium]
MYAEKTHAYLAMPDSSEITVGIAVDTTVISIAAIDKASSRAATVSGRLVLRGSAEVVKEIAR